MVLVVRAKEETRERSRDGMPTFSLRQRWMFLGAPHSGYGVLAGDFSILLVSGLGSLQLCKNGLALDILCTVTKDKEELTSYLCCPSIGDWRLTKSDGATPILPTMLYSNKISPSQESFRQPESPGFWEDFSPTQSVERSGMLLM